MAVAAVVRPGLAGSPAWHAARAANERMVNATYWILIFACSLAGMAGMARGESLDRRQTMAVTRVTNVVKSMRARRLASSIVRHHTSRGVIKRNQTG